MKIIHCLLKTKMNQTLGEYMPVKFALSHGIVFLKIYCIKEESREHTLFLDFMSDIWELDVTIISADWQ